MSSITIERKNFNDEQDGTKEIPYRVPALIRASIAAGRNPENQPKRNDEKAEWKSRESLVRSAVMMRDPLPLATVTYLESRMTNRGHMTEAVANTLCAFSAEVEFNIPWLMNVEELNRYSPSPVIERSDKASRKRTDFIARDRKGEWYVFEAKGRQSKPSNADLEKWKMQARTVKTINRQRPKYHIVAATYLNENNVWTQILYDPPPDERAYALEFDEIDFFRAYYLRLRRRLMSYPIVDETAYGNLYSLGIPGFQVGVHRDFENAAFEGAIERLYELSSAVESGHDSKADFQIFGDGIMVKMVEV